MKIKSFLVLSIIFFASIFFTLPTQVSGEYIEKKADKALSGYTIGIDPGHQEKGDSSLEKIAPSSNKKKARVASGTRGAFTKMYEYQLNLAVGLKLEKELEALGAKVVMTRSVNDINISNAERASLTNESNCNMVIRLHANGASSSKVRGYSILVPGKTYSSSALVSKSRAFGELLDKELKGRISIPSTGIVTRNDLTGFNWSKTPVILLEMGYMTNKADDKEMETNSFQNNVVKGIASALIGYFK